MSSITVSEDVGKADEVLKTKRTGPALHGVDGAEDRIDGFGVGLAGLHRQQALLSVSQELIALLEEGRFDTLERVHGVLRQG
jgi:hypothetical protein